MIHRRGFLIGLASALAAPAIVRAESIMPVRALILPTEELVRGVRWQSWPFGADRPLEWAEGSLGEIGTEVPKTLAEVARDMERHRKIWPHLNWKPIPLSQKTA